jgi:uncharacterized repeat protein (TIGR01451 family)
MNTRRISVPMIIAVMCVAGLLAVSLWLLFTPRSSTADAFTFYSPIPPIGNPQISLTKTIDNPHPQVGDEIVYTLTYANTNPGAQAFNVRLYDFLPAGLQFVSSDPIADAVLGRTVLFTAPSIGPTTQSVQVRVRGRVLQGNSQLYNHALIMADGVVPVHTSLRTDVTQLATWLELVKTGYSAVLTGDELVYMLVCQNNSERTAEEVTLVDVLPTGLPLLGASPAPDEATLPALRWSLGNLAPGEQRTVVVTTTAPASSGTIANTALLDARQGVVTQTVFATQVVDQAAILRVTKKGSAPTVFVGDELVYTLRYENAGNQTATGVTLVDRFPADINVTAVDPPAQSLTDQQGVWVLGPLAPGATGQIVINTTVRGEAGRTLVNEVNITGQSGSFPGHAELETFVRTRVQYLPIVLRDY